MTKVDFVRPKGRLHPFSPLDLSTDWNRGAIVRAKTVRSAAFSGLHPHEHFGYEIERCTGLIELIGAKVGSTSTHLFIGFSKATQLPDPTFEYGSGEAIGTLTLPPDQFSSMLFIAHSASVYFRMGGDGTWNAIATDASLLR
ncbi:hypothetical protein, partial [Acidovorax sp. A1169]|uniref:hypothetical protein n=1 Tax=Acidovorax sp. A1169 TaxID=3059524 RepID=UPI002737F7D3